MWNGTTSGGFPFSSLISHRPRQGLCSFKVWGNNLTLLLLVLCSFIILFIVLLSFIFSLGDLIYFFFLSVADTHCSTHVGCPLTPAQKQSAGLSCKVHLHVQEEIKTFGRLTLWNTSVHHPEKKHMLPVALTWELCNFCCLIWIPSFTGCKSTQSMVS